MKLNEAIGKRIADLMKERGLTAYKLSRMGGVSKQLVYILVKAQHNKIAVDSVYQVAATLGMSLKEFFDDPIFDDISD